MSVGRFSLSLRSGRLIAPAFRATPMPPSGVMEEKPCRWRSSQQCQRCNGPQQEEPVTGSRGASFDMCRSHPAPLTLPCLFGFMLPRERSLQSILASESMLTEAPHPLLGLGFTALHHIIDAVENSRSTKAWKSRLRQHQRPG